MNNTYEVQLEGNDTFFWQGEIQASSLSEAVTKAINIISGNTIELIIKARAELIL